MLGSVATAASFVRMTIFIQTGIPSQAMNRSTVLGLPTYDILGIVSAEVFWTMVESTIALIAVCLPAVRKAVAKSALGKALGIASLSRFVRSLGESKGSRTDSRGSGSCEECEGKVLKTSVIEVS